MNLFFDQYSSQGVCGFCRCVWHISQAEVGEDSQEHLWGVPRRFFFLEMDIMKLLHWSWASARNSTRLDELYDGRVDIQKLEKYR